WVASASWRGFLFRRARWAASDGGDAPSASRRRQVPHLSAARWPRGGCRGFRGCSPIVRLCVEPGRRHRARACRGRATPRCGGCSAPQAHASHVVLLRLRVEPPRCGPRSEEHTSELQSRENLVCRLLLEKKKKRKTTILDS